MITIRLTVNSEVTDVAFAPYKTLLEVLREDLPSVAFDAEDQA